MPLDQPLPFDQSDDFEEDLGGLKTNDRSRFETVLGRCEEIRVNPYKGEPKTEAMAGVYGEHVSNHWVILYQLIPNLPTTADPTDLDMVYFHRYIHHDDQLTAIRNVQSAETVHEFSVRLSYDAGARSLVSDLHSTDWLKIETPQYRDVVHVEGTVPDGRKNDLETMIDAPHDLEWHGRDVSDVF